ncbi:MAG: aromatic hydrocarbon degradation protein, partial [Aquificaceae bacterium]
MKKAIALTALLGIAGLSFATNGDNLIGVSPASRGMGGIGVGMPVGPTDSIFRNPAWMS